jgi:two-component system cell cycle response regulator
MNPARILIVEDNPANLQLMSYLLQSFGYPAESAMDGEEALALVYREPFELIICDIQLPKMDGFEVARRLKGNGPFREIPLVAVTALAMVGDRDKVLSAGFDGYISKPIVPKTFVKQVEAFLQPQRRSVSAPKAAVNRGVPQQNKRHSTYGGTVLVVDNSATNIALTRNTIEPLGIHVVSAESMREALEVARRTMPDLILSDVHMPGGSGFDLIRAVKADARLAHIPFIFLTSSVGSSWQGAERNEGIALGADRFLVRPIDPRAFVAEISAFLPQQVEALHG